MKRKLQRGMKRIEQTKTKAEVKKPFDNRWIYGGIGVVVVLALIAVGVMAFLGMDRTVARIDGRNIMASELGYELWAARSMLEHEYFDMFPGDWEVDENRVMRDGMTFADIQRREAVLSIAMTHLMEREAERMGVGLTAEDRRNINRTIQEEWGTDLSELYEIGITTTDKLRRVLESFEIRNNVINEIRENPAWAARFEHLIPEVEILAAQHILVTFDGFEFDWEAEDFANMLHQRILGGEDFEELMAIYSEDPGQPPQGYTFMPGTMVPEFEDGVRSVAIGEVTPPIASQFGLHIIRRTEPNMMDVMGGGDMPTPIEQAVIEYFREWAEREVRFMSALNRVAVGD